MSRAVALKWVIVEWEDSKVIHGWQVPMFNEPPAKIISVGLLVDINKKTVTLSTSKSGGGNFASQITIPRSAITKLDIKILKL